MTDNALNLISHAARLTPALRCSLYPNVKDEEDGALTYFNEFHPTLENYWRSIILFGRNVASYKFALGKSLLEFAKQGSEIVALPQLAEPFSRHLCAHLRIVDKQATSRSSRFLQSCRNFNSGDIKLDELINVTSNLGFANVIDAFHVVHDGEVGVRFFTDERRGKEKGIRLTQELFRLASSFQYKNLPSEIEARWRLVETAWELSIPRHVLTVAYDAANEVLIVNDKRLARRVITGCRDALNGYQKGRCFYCFADVTIAAASEQLADVDHFFPHVLKANGFGQVIDGVWNLVLACRDCNRGPQGKFHKLPDCKLLQRLHTRNNFFIDSHHPLRETLIEQTGTSEQARREFLQEAYQRAKELLIHSWTPETKYEPAF
jgi:hypothetical protein